MARRRNARSTTLHRAIPIALGIVVATAAWSIPASAQPVEIAPVGGYRFGGGFFEQVTQQQVDLDGAPVFGLVVNVPLHDGLFVEAFASHQQGTVTVPESATVPATRWRIDVDHFQVGGLQEFFDRRRTRPFLTGLLGLTRYAADGDNEIRFTASAGGGVKLMPVPRIGLRLDGRVFATFVEVEGRAIACSPGICLVAFDTNIVWQAEFTAALVVGF
jgi:hypothetical protein